MGNVENYPDLLDTAATKTGDVQDRIDTVLNTLQTSLAGRGAPWGNDKLGNQFANGDGNNGYLCQNEALNTGAGNLASTFANFSNSQSTAAGKLRKMEDGNEGQFR